MNRQQLIPNALQENQTISGTEVQTLAADFVDKGGAV